jgi:hypothetical protein
MGRREIPNATGSLASRVWSSDVPRIVLRTLALSPPSAPVRALSASAPRTTSVVPPADPRTVMERRRVRLPQTDASSGYREARRRRRGAGGERSGRVGGTPASLSSRQGALHASGRNSHGSYPQSPTVVKRTHNEVREFSKLATLSSRRQEHRDTKSTDSAVRRAIVSGVSVTPTEAELGLRKSVWCSRRTLD